MCSSDHSFAHNFSIFSFCRETHVLLARSRPIGDPFYERCNAFNWQYMDSLSGTDVIQTESLEDLNFVVIFELLPMDKEWKSREITFCRSWASCGFNDRNATLEVNFFPTSITLKLELFKCVLFHRTKFEFSFVFTVTVLQIT